MAQTARLVSCGGKTADAAAVSADPVAATGQTLVDTTTGVYHEATVVGGKSYAVTTDATGTMLFGILDSTAAANVIWVCPPSSTIIVNVPGNVTTLHYNGTVANTTAYLREVFRNVGNV